MNILTIIDYLSTSGPSYVAIRTAEALVNAGHKVSFLVLYHDVSIIIDPRITIKTLKLKSTKHYRLKYTKAVHDYVKKLEGTSSIDLILVHLSHSIHLMKTYPHQYVFHYIHNTLSKESTDTYSFIKGQFKLYKLRRQLKGLNLIAVSKGVQDDALNIVKLKPKSIQTIYNPIDIHTIQKLANNNHNIKYQDYIIHIGRFVSQKRHDRLIRAYLQSNINGKLLLIGQGPLKEQSKELVSTLGLTDNVIFHDQLQNPYPFIKNAKLLILSSDYEGLGFVLLEALALQTPIISTDCPHGPKEIFKNYISENLIAIDDEDALARQIHKVYTHPDDYIPDHSCINPFTYTAIAKKFELLIKTTDIDSFN